MGMSDDIFCFLGDKNLSSVLHCSKAFRSVDLKRISGVSLNPSELFFRTIVIAALTELLVLVLKMPCFLPQKIFPGTLSKEKISPLY